MKQSRRLACGKAAVVAGRWCLCLLGAIPACGFAATAGQMSFPLVTDSGAADVWVAAEDWSVARIASDDLAGDIERITGKRPRVMHEATGLSPRALLVGTLGKSPLIDGLVKAGRLDVSDVRDRWETFAIEMVEDPLPGVERALVIAGSDRRGTAYGAYELSRRIGVSPWVWWADVAPRHRQTLEVPAERVRIGPPAVKYRGIFINDEMWGIRPWSKGTLASEEVGGLGPTTYAKVFELLLRLRANHLWPAMHLHTPPFNTDPYNKSVADDYAIVMGSSHIEPLLRNNMPFAEWDREGKGPWNYLTNRDNILRYWDKRVAENSRYENLYTLGMRGRDDEPMEGGETREEKIALLERIFHDQREILAKHVNPDLARVPQVFIPYTEVLGLYDAGMKVPEDVTICWPDDNFGYIRRLPDDTERRRSGGSGIYYHIQWLNGATTAYPWLNTMPPPLIATEMGKAWQHGAQRLWVLNVGDIKPGEIGMDFFLDMAWDPECSKDVRGWLKRWAARDLDARFAGEIADIMMEYYQLGFIRRPEHLLQCRRGGDWEFSWFSHDHFGDEASLRLLRYDAIAAKAQAIYDRLPDDRKAAFFQFVLYPVKASALMNRKIIHADKSMRDGENGRATAHRHAEIARAAAEEIRALDRIYNEEMPGVGAKWRHMMTSTPGPWGEQRHQFEMPPLSDFPGGGPPELEVAPEGGRKGEVDDLSIYTREIRFIDLFNLGKGVIRWKAESSMPWLKVVPAAGTFEATERVRISIDWDAFPQRLERDLAIRFTSNAGEDIVRVPVFAPAAPQRDEVRGFVESHGCVSMEAEHATRRIDRGGAGWVVIDGLGRSGSSVTVEPSTVASRADPAEIEAHSPCLEFDLHVFGTGTFELHLDCLPTYPVAPGRGSRLAVSVDDGEPVIPEIQVAGPSGPQLSNLRRWKLPVDIRQAGDHTLKVWMVDPGVILDRVVLHTEAPAESCLGPPESYHR